MISRALKNYRQESAVHKTDTWLLLPFLCLKQLYPVKYAGYCHCGFVCSLVLILIFPWSPSHAGGPWNLPAGSGYAQLGFSGISYDQMYDGADQGNPYQLTRQVTDITLQGYLEYGLSERINLLGMLPFKFVSTGDELFPADPRLGAADTLPAASLAGPGNISAGLRYQFLSAPITLAARFTADANSISTNEDAGLATGTACWTFRPAIDIGFSAKRWYAFAETGIGFRTNDYPHLLLGTAEAGYNFFGARTWVVAVIEMNLTLSAEEDSIYPPSQGATGLYLSNQEFVSYGIKLLQSVGKHWWVNGGIMGAMYGNLVAYSPSYNLSVAYRW
jgi:hypothetical protein